MTLTPFSRSQEGLDCWKMVCMQPIFWMNKWILTKLVQLYCWDMKKYWLDFGDLDPIFKVTVRLKLLENCLSAPYLLNEWMDYDQLVHPNCYDMEKNWLDFEDHDPIFKVTLRLTLVENGLSAPCLLKEWVDFDQTCTAIFLGHASELIIFWWPSPHFSRSD